MLADVKNIERFAARTRLRIAQIAKSGVPAAQTDIGRHHRQ